MCLSIVTEAVYATHVSFRWYQAWALHCKKASLPMVDPVMDAGPWYLARRSAALVTVCLGAGTRLKMLSQSREGMAHEAPCGIVGFL